MERVCVLGAGSWGTALCGLLAGQVEQVRLYCRGPEQALALNRDKRNPSHFPGYDLSVNLLATSDLSEAMDGCAVIYLSLPSSAIRGVVEKHSGAWELWQDVYAAQGKTPTLVNCSKGLLAEPTERSDEWLTRQLPRAAIAHLSGPNLAAEIVAGQPAAAVIAINQGYEEHAQLVQRQLSSERFRAYTGTDLVGVEVSGFYKNIIAIAAGMLEGLRLGSNTRAVLITRGLAEMGRLVAWFGGDPATLLGLAGVGDLVVTCSSTLSRNYQAGMRRARGESVEQIVAEMKEVAEGINTSKALWEWKDRGTGASAFPDLPIAEQVYRVLHDGRDPRESITELMSRPLKAEQQTG